MMEGIAAKREAASEAMDFEGAAALHRQWEKARAVFQSADPLVRAANEVRALVVQEAGDGGVFLLENGRIVGPVRLSTLGVRAVREQTAVGSSLFAQPLMLSAVPETTALDEGEGGALQPAPAASLPAPPPARSTPARSTAASPPPCSTTARTG